MAQYDDSFKLKKYACVGVLISGLFAMSACANETPQNSGSEEPAASVVETSQEPASESPSSVSTGETNTTGTPKNTPVAPVEIKQPVIVEPAPRPVLSRPVEARAEQPVPTTSSGGTTPKDRIVVGQPIQVQPRPSQPQPTRADIRQQYIVSFEKDTKVASIKKTFATDQATAQKQWTEYWTANYPNQEPPKLVGFMSGDNARVSFTGTAEENERLMSLVKSSKDVRYIEGIGLSYPQD